MPFVWYKTIHICKIRTVYFANPEFEFTNTKTVKYFATLQNFYFLGGGATSIWDSVCVFVYLYICGINNWFRDYDLKSPNLASANLLLSMFLLGIDATNSVTGKEDDRHEIKQAVNCMGSELFLNNAPPPPASNFVHF